MRWPSHQICHWTCPTCHWTRPACHWTPVLKLFLGDLCFIGPVQHFILPVQHFILPVQHFILPVQHVIGPVQHVIGPVQHVIRPRVKTIFFWETSVSLDLSNMSFDPCLNRRSGVA
ncbi:hypothetical protein TNCV_381981 [Trichonephila clavipes]|nr:hypothetical protein TNCV_381981 [Trichonephila clavipes]